MNELSPVVRIVLMVVTWFLWILPVLGARRQRQAAARLDPGARFGIAFQTAGFALLFTHGPIEWSSPLQVWRAIAGLAFALLAIALFRNAVAALGKQWRIEAALSEDHKLIQTGAYRLVRHPIYASMLCLFIAGAFWVGTLPAWPVAAVLFLIGIEIRVRVEDGLLLERFGAQFTQWRDSRPAYLPFVR